MVHLMMTSTLWKKRRPLGGDIARVSESISACDGGDSNSDTDQFIVVITTDNLLLSAFRQELYRYGQGIFIAIDASWLH
jgi:hypothetical protein